MNATEDRAFAHLRALKFGKVEYEPDGNVPPDFTVNGRIAVEVRQLNQNVADARGAMTGVEQLDFTLVRWLRAELARRPPVGNEESWAVSLKFRRPLSFSKALRSAIGKSVEKFYATSARVEVVLNVHPNLKLIFRSAGRQYGSLFFLASVSDLDRGGFVLAEALRNVEMCMAEKRRKIEKYRSKYEEWWLVLVDTLHLGMQLGDWSQVSSFTDKSVHGWSKVHILSSEFSDTFFSL